MSKYRTEVYIERMHKGEWTEITVEVDYEINGSYRAATHWDPAEEPELEITGLRIIDPVELATDDVKDHEVWYGILDPKEARADSGTDRAEWCQFEVEAFERYNEDMMDGGYDG